MCWPNSNFAFPQTKWNRMEVTACYIAMHLLGQFHCLGVFILLSF